MQNKHSCILVFGFKLLATFGNDDLDTTVVNLALNEYLFHITCFGDAFTVHDCLVRSENCKAPGFDAGKISFSSRFHTVFGRSYRVIEVQNNKGKYVGSISAGSPASVGP